MEKVKVRFPCCGREIIFKMQLLDKRFKTICYQCWKIHDGKLSPEGYRIFKTASLNDARIKFQRA